MEELIQQVLVTQPSASISNKLTPSSRQLSQIHEQLDQKLIELKQETRDTLIDNWTAFNHQLNSNSSFLSSFNHINEQLNQLELETIGEHSFLPDLLKRLSLHSNLASAHSASVHAVHLLRTLSALHSAISHLSQHSTLGLLPTSVSSLHAVRALIQRPTDTWITSTEIWTVLLKWADDEDIRLQEALIGAVEACFELIREGTQLRLRKEVSVAPGGKRIQLLEVLSALEHSNNKGREKLERALEKVANNLVKYFVAPYLDANGALEFVYLSGEDDVENVSLLPSSSQIKSPDPLPFLSTFLTFIQCHSSLLPPSPYAPIFTLHLTPQIQHLLLTSHLLPSLPSSLASLPPYLPALSATESFESVFLPQNGFFAFLPPNAQGGEHPEAQIVRTWIASIDKYWAKKVAESKLSRAREIVLKVGWEKTERVDILVDVVEDSLRPPVATGSVEGEGEQRHNPKEDAEEAADSRQKRWSRASSRRRSPPPPIMVPTQTPFPPVIQDQQLPLPPSPAPAPVKGRRLGTRISAAASPIPRSDSPSPPPRLPPQPIPVVPVTPIAPISPPPLQPLQSQPSPPVQPLHSVLAPAAIIIPSSVEPTAVTKVASPPLVPRALSSFLVPIVIPSAPKSDPPVEITKHEPPKPQCPPILPPLRSPPISLPESSLQLTPEKEVSPASPPAVPFMPSQVTLPPKTNIIPPSPNPHIQLQQSRGPGQFPPPPPPPPHGHARSPSHSRTPSFSGSLPVAPAHARTPSIGRATPPAISPPLYRGSYPPSEQHIARENGQNAQQQPIAASQQQQYPHLQRRPSVIGQKAPPPPPPMQSQGPPLLQRRPSFTANPPPPPAPFLTRSLSNAPAPPFFGHGGVGNTPPQYRPLQQSTSGPMRAQSASPPPGTSRALSPPLIPHSQQRFKTPPPPSLGQSRPPGTPSGFIPTPNANPQQNPSPLFRPPMPPPPQARRPSLPPVPSFGPRANPQAMVRSPSAGPIPPRGRTPTGLHEQQQQPRAPSAGPIPPPHLNRGPSPMLSPPPPNGSRPSNLPNGYPHPPPARAFGRMSSPPLSPPPRQQGFSGFSGFGPPPPPPPRGLVSLPLSPTYNNQQQTQPPHNFSRLGHPGNPSQPQYPARYPTPPQSFAQMYAPPPNPNRLASPPPRNSSPALSSSAGVSRVVSPSPTFSSLDGIMLQSPPLPPRSPSFHTIPPPSPTEGDLDEEWGMSKQAGSAGEEDDEIDVEMGRSGRERAMSDLGSDMDDQDEDEDDAWGLEVQLDPESAGMERGFSGLSDQSSIEEGWGLDLELADELELEEEEVQDEDGVGAELQTEDEELSSLVDAYGGEEPKEEPTDKMAPTTDAIRGAVEELGPEMILVQSPTFLDLQVLPSTRGTSPVVLDTRDKGHASQLAPMAPISIDSLSPDIARPPVFTSPDIQQRFLPQERASTAGEPEADSFGAAWNEDLENGDSLGDAWKWNDEEEKPKDTSISSPQSPSYPPPSIIAPSTQIGSPPTPLAPEVTPRSTSPFAPEDATDISLGDAWKLEDTEEPVIVPTGRLSASPRQTAFTPISQYAIEDVSGLSLAPGMPVDGPLVLVEERTTPSVGTENLVIPLALSTIASALIPHSVDQPAPPAVVRDPSAPSFESDVASEPLASSSDDGDEDHDESGGDVWKWDDEDDKIPIDVPRKTASSPSVGVPPPATNGNAAHEEEIDDTHRKESMLVSASSRKIVDLAQEVLVEALEVGSENFPHPQFASASPVLLQSFNAILSLYRATMPVQHGALLIAVPALGMQFANDCIWIGDEVGRRWDKAANGKARPADEQEVTRSTERMRQLGAEWRAKLVSAQRDALMESLDDAERFLNTADDTRYAACDRAIAQVMHTLERLAIVWKPVMNPTAFYATLGSLVNDVLIRVLDEIEDQADISEDESIRLNKLCKVLHGLEALFVDGPTSVGGEVPVWFKFVFLSELLEASMADILFLFDHGHLVDFSTQEISRLVRALFADSPVRERNLAHIAQGHPDKVEDDSSGSEDGEGWD